MTAAVPPAGPLHLLHHPAVAGCGRPTSPYGIRAGEIMGLTEMHSGVVPWGWTSNPHYLANDGAVYVLSRVFAQSINTLTTGGTGITAEVFRGVCSLLLFFLYGFHGRCYARCHVWRPSRFGRMARADCALLEKQPGHTSCRQRRVESCVGAATRIAYYGFCYTS